MRRQARSVTGQGCWHLLKQEIQDKTNFSSPQCECCFLVCVFLRHKVKIFAFHLLKYKIGPYIDNISSCLLLFIMSNDQQVQPRKEGGDDRYAMLYILKLPMNPVLRSHQDLSFIGYCPTFYVIYIMHRLSAKKMKTSGKTKTKNNIYDFTGIKTSGKGHFFLLNL